MKDAFRDNDGKKVPLIWNHDHDNPEAVLGHAYLENVKDGVKAYCVFNDTPRGRTSKELVKHHDVVGLSIYANQLKQNKGNVTHGNIREVSLVLAGANPGAYIEDVMCHADGTLDEAIVFNDEPGIELSHADAEKQEEPKGDKKEMPNTDKTVKEVFDTLTEEQKTVVYALIGEALKDRGGDDSEEGDDSMKHNVFDTSDSMYTGADYGTTLTHSDLSTIVANAKRSGGSMRDAFNDYLTTLSHGDGDEQAPVAYTDRQGNPIVYNLDSDGPYGVGNYEYFFPDARMVGDKPSVIRRETSWVSKVVNAAKHSPFSRIKTVHADLTEDQARAKGYIKGKYKKNEFFSLLRRVTTPCTIYKKQKLDRDDVIDITEWDVVAWLRQEMRWMLDEEVARAALIGDGRLADDEDKINEQCIRPIATDDDLYTIHISMANTGVKSVGNRAKDFINAVIWNRKRYKGSGSPTLFTTEDMLTECLMLTDEIGRDLYESEAKLATKMRVKEIVTVPVLEGTQYLGIVVNMQDYTFGSDKGGSVTLMDDFDIDFNQYKYLIETRLSGALTLPYSAMVFTAATQAASEPAEPAEPGT
jgi:hypothetical protein